MENISKKQVKVTGMKENATKFCVQNCESIRKRFRISTQKDSTSRHRNERTYRESISKRAVLSCFHDVIRIHMKYLAICVLCTYNKAILEH